MPKLRRTPDEIVNDNFIEYVAGHMRSHNVYQKDLAPVLGISRQQIGKKLNKQAKWTLKEMALICDYFGDPFTIGGEKK